MEDTSLGNNAIPFHYSNPSSKLERPNTRHACVKYIATLAPKKLLNFQGKVLHIQDVSVLS